MAPTALTKLKLAKNNPLDAQEELLQTFVPTDKPYFKTASLINEPHHTNETIEATFKVNSTGDLHLYIPNLKWKKSYKIEGKPTSYLDADLYCNQSTVQFRAF